MSQNKRKGFIILRHPVLTAITIKEVESVLDRDFREQYPILDFRHIEIKPTPDHISHKTIKQINWAEAASIQEQLIEEKLNPLVKEFPDYELVYFGATPIPLAIHLGYLLEGWKRIRIYLRHHNGSKEWYGHVDSIKKEEIIQSGFPKDNFDTTDDVVIQVLTSYNVIQPKLDKSITSKVVKTLKIQLENLQLDIDSTETAVKVADSFSNGLKAVHDYLPQTNTVHLIATVPVGLALLIGTKITSNINRPIQTYQYFREDEFPYFAALEINTSYEVFSPLDSKELKQARKTRKQFKNNSWKNLQALIKLEQNNLKKDSKLNWLDEVFEVGTKKGDLQTRFWTDLPLLATTALANTEFSNSEDVDGYKYFEDKDEWGVGNHLIHNLSKRLSDIKDIERAIRIILIHEGMHYYTHNLSSATVESIGRFPKIIEDADYQADTYAMFYEYHYSKLYDSNAIDEKRAGIFFANTLETAIAALWSFNDPGIKMKEIQVRRLNRFLIWYWQFLAVSDPRVKTLKSVINILSNKPIIEVKGIEIRQEGQRVLYQLDQYNESNLEIGLFINNKIIRTGNLGYFRIPDLLNGFKERNHEQIKKVLGGLYRHVTSHF